MCGYAYSNPAIRFLKKRITVAGHKWHKRRSHTTAKRKRDKLQSTQNKLPKIKRGEKEINNYCQFEYLGSIFQLDGDHMPEVLRRIVMIKSKSGQLSHILSSDNLSLDLSMRLYVAGCCSIVTFGAET